MAFDMTVRHEGREIALATRFLTSGGHGIQMNVVFEDWIRLQRLRALDNPEDMNWRPNNTAQTLMEKWMDGCVKVTWTWARKVL